MSSVKRKDLVDLMAAMGISHNSKISAERAETRIRKHVEKEGVPAGLDDEQMGILRSLDIPVAENKDPVDPAPEEKKATTKKQTGMAFFKQFFGELDGSISRKEAVEQITKASGINEAVTKRRIWMAATGRAEFPFTLEQVKTKDGEVVLTATVKS